MIKNHLKQITFIEEGVEPLISNNWKFEMDNELPTEFKPVFIPRLKWHKIIPENGFFMIKFI